MSSLAASRADNFYFPPEWRPEMGGISKFQGSNGANQYQKYGIIRYELPFDAWCLQCSTHMCKGLRFNAKKDKIGKYFSTPIYSFTTKCYNCSQQFVIKTDPEHRTYDFAEGLRKMEQDFEAGADDSILQPLSDEAKAQLQKDPMFKLQHDKEDRLKASSANAAIESLIELRDAEAKNDYDMNSLLRKKNRTHKTRQAELLKEGGRHGLGIALSEPSPADVDGAREALAGRASRGFRTSEKVRMVQIINQPIFTPAAAVSLTSRAGVPSSSLSLVPFSNNSNNNNNSISGSISEGGKEARKRRREGEALEKKAALGISATGMVIRRRNDSDGSVSKAGIMTPVLVQAKRKCDLKYDVNSVEKSVCSELPQSDARSLLCSYGSDDDSS